MKLIFLTIFLCLFYDGSAQGDIDCQQKYLFNNIEEKYLYKLSADYKTDTSIVHFYFHIGSVKAGLYYSGSFKRIEIIQNDTISGNYKWDKLEKHQLDSLKRFEIELCDFCNLHPSKYGQSITISYQNTFHEYIIDTKFGWDAVKQLSTILGRNSGK